jgi:chaperone required for assembly of F1-ATPase
MPNDPAETPGAKIRRGALATERRRRFYTKAGVGEHGGGFALLLDGRLAKTPAKAVLVLPTLAAAEAVAAEWEAQKTEIDRASMRLTRIANTAIDGVAHAMEVVVDEIVKYAETDLVCYRASGPESLVHAEAEAWDPILAFAASRLGAHFIYTEGIGFIEQPAAAIATVKAKVEEVARRGQTAPLALASLSVMTTLAGSVLIALALAEGAISLEEAWRAAHVDEDFEIKLWGTDEEAMQRRAGRFAEMAAADRLWRLSAA